MGSKCPFNHHRIHSHHIYTHTPLPKFDLKLFIQLGNYINYSQDPVHHIHVHRIDINIHTHSFSFPRPSDPFPDRCTLSRRTTTRWLIHFLPIYIIYHLLRHYSQHLAHVLNIGDRPHKYLHYHLLCAYYNQLSASSWAADYRDYKSYDNFLSCDRDYAL